MRQDDSPATWGDIKKIYSRLKKMVEEVDQRVGECFEAVAQGDETQSNFWDEHEEKIARLQRAMNRLKREFEDHEHEEDE